MKPHYPILDGLRGVAAVLVVVFHILEAHHPVYAQHLIHHGYLAVDFFFLLSGFVIGYAYDDRWGSMSTWDFLKIRLVRLHPLVVMGTVVGAIGFVLDPYTNGMAHTSWLKLLGVMLISFSLLPAPDIRAWDGTHPLDGPLGRCSRNISPTSSTPSLAGGWALGCVVYLSIMRGLPKHLYRTTNPIIRI